MPLLLYLLTKPLPAHLIPWKGFNPDEGRTILVRYVWLDLSPNSARMEQSYSPDGG